MSVCCPKCGESSFQEFAYRFTWQPVLLEVCDDGSLDQVEYSSFNYGDDVWMVAVECQDCEEQWPTYDDLRKAIAGEPHKTGTLEATFSEPEEAST